MAAPATKTFKTHYDNLRTIAEKMRSQQEPDIDQLIPMVDSALGSYKICKERLDNVRKLVGIHRARYLLTGAAPISPERSAVTARQARPPRAKRRPEPRRRRATPPRSRAT